MLFPTSHVHKHVKGMLIGKSCYAYAASHSHFACSARTLRVVAQLVWFGSASTLHMVLVARLARCARSGRCSWRLATIVVLVPHPEYYCLHGCCTKRLRGFIITFLKFRSRMRK